MIILIPAYKPDESLVQLAEQITELDAHAEILVVDDGSGSTLRADLYRVGDSGRHDYCPPCKPRKRRGPAHRAGVGTDASVRSHCGDGGC